MEKCIKKKKQTVFGLKRAKYTYAPDRNKQRFSVDIKASGIFKYEVTPDEKAEILFIIERGVNMLKAMRNELNKKA